MARREDEALEVMDFPARDGAGVVEEPLGWPTVAAWHGVGRGWCEYDRSSILADRDSDYLM